MAHEPKKTGTVDLGDGVYAYTAMDIFTKEPSVVIGTNLEMNTGAKAFAVHNAFYGSVLLHQSDNGSPSSKQPSERG